MNQNGVGHQGLITRCSSRVNSINWFQKVTLRYGREFMDYERESSLNCEADEAHWWGCKVRQNDLWEGGEAYFHQLQERCCQLIYIIFFLVCMDKEVGSLTLTTICVSILQSGDQRHS